MDKKPYQNQTAIKILIKDILEGYLTQENNEGLTFLQTTSKRIHRINLIGVVVKKEKTGSITNVFVDDASGKIVIRFFEENKSTEKISVGDVIVVVGKIRSYQEEKYISPEIVKKVAPLWLKVRSLELSLSEEKESKEDLPIEKVEEEKVLEKKEVSLLPFQKIAKLIKELDQGEGVLIEEIIEKSSLQETEQILDKMLETGDIFQNLPGKIKVL